MAAAGGSYGGYMMAWLNGHTDRFKAMVCHAGVYNWHSMLASDFVKGRERALGAPPWGDLAQIDKQNAAAVRGQLQDADARHPRRKGFSRAGDAGAGVLQHASAEGRAGAADLLPGRESLGAEAARTRYSGTARSSRGWKSTSGLGPTRIDLLRRERSER